MDRDWDQLPDLDLGIEDALSAAQNYFKTQAPEVELPLAQGIEPMLDGQPAPVADEFDPPPVLDDHDVFEDDDIPPVLDELEDDHVQDFSEDLPPYQAPPVADESSKYPSRLWEVVILVTKIPPLQIHLAMISNPVRCSRS